MTNTELLNTQTSANQTDKENSSELIKRLPIENTPFTMVVQENETFITLGQYKLSPDVENIEGVKKYLEENKWEITMALIAIIVKSELEVKNEQ